MRSRSGTTPERAALRRTRQRAGLSQQQVAEAVGISRSFYTLIERGGRTPSLSVALRIAEFFGVTPGELFPLSPAGTVGLGSARPVGETKGEDEP